MSRDKEFEARMQGMRYAYEYAKANGVEELEKEMKRRNYTKIPLNVPEKGMKHFVEEVSNRLYTMTLTTFLFALHDEYGFGKKRLKRMKDSFDKLIQSTYDLDYMSAHYVTMGDYAKELNDKYDIGIDLDRVDNCQESVDKNNEDYRMCRIDRVLEVMRRDGFEEAAAYLESKLG
jgi:hypothetical protein